MTVDMTASPVCDHAGDAPGGWDEAALVRFAYERIAKGSKSFAGAARLFAPDVRASACLLYAWCRHCDDEIDGQDLGFNTAAAATAATNERLARLREKTVAAIEGRASEPMFLALQTVVARHRLPPRLPLDLIEGMAMDVRAERYHTLPDTLRYCYHVAGCVGVMMAIVMGARARPTLERACDLGMAFQLTNIVRDVSADAAVGRVYLPADWLAAAGVPASATTEPAAIAAAIADPAHAAAVHAVKLRLLVQADRYYASAWWGLADLPVRSALAIAAARRVYADIGNVVRETGHDAGRAQVSSARKRRNLVAAVGDVIAAKTAGRIFAPPPRTDLWTMPAIVT